MWFKSLGFTPRDLFLLIIIISLNNLFGSFFFFFHPCVYNTAVYMLQDTETLQRVLRRLGLNVITYVRDTNLFFWPEILQVRREMAAGEHRLRPCLSASTKSLFVAGKKKKEKKEDVAEKSAKQLCDAWVAFHANRFQANKLILHKSKMKTPLKLYTIWTFFCALRDEQRSHPVMFSVCTNLAPFFFFFLILSPVLIHITERKKKVVGF